MDIAILVLGIALLSALVIIGFQMPVAAILAGSTVLVLSGMSVYDGVLTSFMSGFATFFQNYWILMFLASLFGKVIEMGGVTSTISTQIVDRLGPKYVIVTIMAVQFILGFGGVNAYVAIFTTYPLAVAMFKKADIPRRIYPGIYTAVSAFTTPSAWTVGLHNVIPTKYLGTTLGADGLVSVLVILIFLPLTTLYLYWRARKYKRDNIHFEPLPDDPDFQTEEKYPNLVVALLPIVILLLAVNALGLKPETGVLVGIIAGIIFYFPYLPKDKKTIFGSLGDAISGTLGMMASIGSATAFGAIITSTAAYGRIIPSLVNMGGNPLLAAAVITTVMAGVAASAGGGLSIAMPMLAETFLPLGVNPQALHRIAALACCGLDTLPHNGAVTGILFHSHTTLKEGYDNIFVCSVVVPILYTLFAILFHTITGTVYV